MTKVSMSWRVGSTIFLTASLFLLARGVQADDAPNADKSDLTPIPSESATPTSAIATDGPDVEDEPVNTQYPKTVAPREVPPPRTRRPRQPFRRGTTSTPVQIARANQGPWLVPPRVLPPGRPLAGYSGGLFFLRNPSNDFILNPMGRLQIDSFGYAGEGVSDYRRSNQTGLTPNMHIRRLRMELNGRLYKKFEFYFSGDFASRASWDSNQNGVRSPQIFDAIVALNLLPELTFQVGQFAIPFGLENNTSSKFWEFLDRGMTSGLVGAPLRRDMGVMVRGDVAKGIFSYAVGLFGGEGFNRANVDSRMDVVGRAYVRPFAHTRSFLKNAHIGVSGRYGSRDPNYVRYEAPGMTTWGNYEFWAPRYGSGAAETRIIPSRDQAAFGADMFVPLGRFDLMGEFVYTHEGRREALLSDLNRTERAGVLSGAAYFAQVSFWPYGPPRLTNTKPGNFHFYYPSFQFAPSPPKFALQLLARWEQMFLNYDSLSASEGSNATRGLLDRNSQAVRANALQLGVNAFFNQHFRISLHWSMYMFPGAPAHQLGGENQAVAPGAVLRANGSVASPDARTLHEFGMRWQAAF